MLLLFYQDYLDYLGKIIYNSQKGGVHYNKTD